MLEKTLAPGEMRFVVRPRRTSPRTVLWEIYDRQRGSIPISLLAFGRVAQDHPSEEAAQAEADRLEALR